VGFAARWRTELLALTGDRGAREILAAHPDELVLLPTDDTGVLRDVDRVGDLATEAGPLSPARQAFARAE
jgi:molybdenum cofactor cytidylyltransferase